MAEEKEKKKVPPVGHLVSSVDGNSNLSALCSLCFAQDAATEDAPDVTGLAVSDQRSVEEGKKEREQPFPRLAINAAIAPWTSKGAIDLRSLHECLNSPCYLH